MSYINLINGLQIMCLMKGSRSILGERRGYSERFVPNIGRLIEEDTLRREREARLKPKDAEPNVEAAKAEGEKNISDSNVHSIDDFLLIPDIQCVAADGAVFERYYLIYVAKDVERDGSNHVNFTPYKAISYFEGKGMFLPSFVLSCNVLAYLFANKNNKDAQKLLMQYKDHGAGYGWHAQNTIIDWKLGFIRHYPLDGHFPKDGGSDVVNQPRPRKEFGFKVEGFGDVALEDALGKTEFKNFIINLTGLENPEVLVEIGKYFGKPARIWVPNNPSDAKYTSASWLGCNFNNLIIDANDVLVSGSAGREVREA